MRNYHDVVKSVRDGTPTTDEELKYALTLSHYFLMRQYFDSKAYLAEPTVTKRNKLERLHGLFDSTVGQDMEAFLKGSSMEPGISEAERRKRITSNTATVASKLFTVLTDASKQR